MVPVFLGMTGPGTVEQDLYPDWPGGLGGGHQGRVVRAGRELERNHESNRYRPGWSAGV